MDWNVLVAELEGLTLFELGSLRRLVSELCDDPKRVAQARIQLRPGMEVEYWHSQSRGYVKATVVELQRTTVLVQHVEDKEKWTIHLSLLAPPATTPVPRTVPSLPKSEWRVGDMVGFKDRQNRDRIGTIQKKNPRRAEIRLKNGDIWQVHYEYLVRIQELDAKNEEDRPPFIEYKVL